MSSVKDLGAVSAYALAVKYGYVGTEEEWVTEQENKRKQAVEAASSAATNANTVLQNVSVARESATTASNARDEAVEAAEQAKTYAENASAVTGVEIAGQDTAGLVKGGDNYIGEDGTLHLTMQTDSATLSNSYSGGVKINEIGGASEQESTTGAQLFDENALTSDASGTFTVDENVIKLTGTKAYAGAHYTLPDPTLYAGQTVTLSYESFSKTNSAGSVIIQARLTLTDNTSSDKSIQSAETSISFEVPTDIKYVIVQLIVNNSATALDEENTVTFRGIMLNVGDTALPWEPYTGNAPSPSTDYPQEIESVVVSEVETVGKNHLKNNAVTTTVNGGTFTVNNDGTVTVNGTFTADTAFRLAGTSAEFRKRFLGKKIILSGCPSGGSNSTYRLQFYGYGVTSEQARDIGNGATFTFTNEDSNFNVSIVIMSGTSVSNLTFFPMLRKADIEDATYVPYQSSSIALSSPITLHGIGGVKDRIVRKDGVWGVERKFAEVVFDGSDESWYPQSSNETTALFNMRNGLYATYGCRLEDYSANYLCSHTKPNSTSATESNTKIGSYVYTNTFRIRVSTELASTVDEFVSWLSENPITCEFPLAEPTFEPLPTADQIALNSLVTYDTATYLSCDSVIEPTWDLEYGTSKVGAYTLDAWNTAKRNEIIATNNADRLTALEALATATE